MLIWLIRKTKTISFKNFLGQISQTRLKMTEFNKF